MIKDSSQEYKYQYLRYDTEWQFKWNFQVDEDGTIKFYPLKKSADGASWYFCAEGDPDTGHSIDHNPDYWQENNPVFEYEVCPDPPPEDSGDGTGPNAYTDAWDALHPHNLTRYLRPGESGIIRLTNTIKYVHIDTVAPKFISDNGTDYVVFKKESEPAIRNCSFEFTDSVGLDYRQIVIKLGNTPLYSYNRKNGELYIDSDKINSLNIYSNGNGKYKVEFQLVYGQDKTEVETLNTEKLIIDVFDKAANHTEYTFGNDGSLEDKDKNEWKVVNTDIEFKDLDRLIITYYDIQPTNMIVDTNTAGSVWVSIYNPNRDYWMIPITYQLSDDSVGRIDESTYDDSTYEIDGCIKFKIVDVDESGIITTQAWLETGIGNDIDKTLFSATYAEESLGFWRVLDPEGRLYNTKIFVPPFLRNSTYFEFMKFVELYLNSCYTDLKKRKSISALEKTARVLDFNEVDRMEDELLPHYAYQHGFEFDIDLESVARIFEGKVDEQ